MRNFNITPNWPSALWLALCTALSPLAHAVEPAAQPAMEPAPAFAWESSEPLIKPPADAEGLFGVKDPSVVFHDKRYHVFFTTAGTKGWGMAYTSFADWKDAPRAPVFMLDQSPIGPGYRAAPDGRCGSRRSVATCGSSDSGLARARHDRISLGRSRATVPPGVASALTTSRQRLRSGW